MKLTAEFVLKAIHLALDRRGAFHSEKDFQHELAWSFRTLDEKLELRLEVPIGSDHLDIVVRDIGTGMKLGIELKYRTKSAGFNFRDESYSLKHHGAHPIGRFQFIEDIHRLERFIAEHVIDEGFAILLTNDETYRKAGQKNLVAEEFAIHDDRVLAGELRWAKHTGGGTMKGREAGVLLKNLNWLDLPLASKNSPKFSLLIVKIPGLSA